MADWAASVDAIYFFDPKLLESQRENKSGANFKAMLQGWSQSHHPKLAHTASFLEKLQQDWNSMQIFQSSCGLEISFSRGLHLVFQQLRFYAVKNEADAAVTMMRQLSRPSQASAPTNDEPPGLNVRGFMCRYLLAAAGSGKTQRLMDELSICYGFYLSSGAINDDPTVFNDGEALYQPRTMGSSRDTKLLFDTTQVPWMRNVASVRLKQRGSCLIDSRIELLLRVINLSKNQSLCFTLSPQTWLQYQLSCQSERDSFLRLFRLSMIANFPPEFLGQNATKGLKILWCFDEVQCDLSELRLQFDSGSTTVLESLINALKVRHIETRRFMMQYFGNSRNICLLSGTALNIDKVRAVVHKTHTIWRQSAIEDFMPSYTLVTDDRIFTKVFDRRMTELLNILHDSNSPEAFVRNTYCRGAVFIPANERAFNRSGLFHQFREYCGNNEPPPTTEIMKNLKHPSRKFYRIAFHFVDVIVGQCTTLKNFSKNLSWLG